MSTSVVAEILPEHDPAIEVVGHIRAVSEDPDVYRQLGALHHFSIRSLRRRYTESSEPWGKAWGERVDVPLAEALADVAIENTVSESLMVRLQALDQALSLGFRPGYREGQVPNRYAVIAGAQEFAQPFLDERDFEEGTAYAYITRTLSENEHVQRNVATAMSAFDQKKGFLVEQRVRPAAAYVYLSELEALLPESSEDAARFAPLIADIHAAMAEQVGLSHTPNVQLKDWRDVAACSRLLSYGENYEHVFMDILDSGNPAAMEYVHKLGALYKLAGSACLAYPETYRQGTLDSMRNLLADALYATLYDIQHGNSVDIRLPMPGGDTGWPLQLRTAESLELLDALKVSFEDQAHVGRLLADWKTLQGGAGADGGLKTIRVGQSNEFSLYRLVGRTGEILRPTVYIRKYGAANYDQSLEYGRPKQGVEASYGIISDVGHASDVLSEVGPHRRRGDDKRVSVRLDREGREPGKRDFRVPHDPTQERGTVSLDVSSVLGSGNSLCTKLGRFLAFGNVIRTQSTGVEAGLNHMTDYFSPQDGRAEVFATAVGEVEQILEACRLTPEQVAALFAGRAAVRAAE
jgi:hypothetical protein